MTNCVGMLVIEGAKKGTNLSLEWIMADIDLGWNTHGKGRVRVVKVTRNADGSQDVVQLSVQVLLEGDVMKDGFISGDNATVVATDTCKNTVYCLAKDHDFKSIEEFGLIICSHFIKEYPEFVNKINVKIIKDVRQK